METKFQELKSIILESAKKAGACKEEYAKAYKSQSESELLQVVKENFNWCCNNSVLTGDLIDSFKEIFNENKILHNESFKNGFILAYGSATVEAYGSATVEASGRTYCICNSTIECKISDSAIVRRANSNTIEFADETIKFKKV